MADSFNCPETIYSTSSHCIIWNIYPSAKSSGSIWIMPNASATNSSFLAVVIETCTAFVRSSSSYMERNGGASSSLGVPSELPPNRPLGRVIGFPSSEVVFVPSELHPKRPLGNFTETPSSDESYFLVTRVEMSLSCSAVDREA